MLVHSKKVIKNFIKINKSKIKIRGDYCNCDHREKDFCLLFCSCLDKEGDNYIRCNTCKKYIKENIFKRLLKLIKRKLK